MLPDVRILITTLHFYRRAAASTENRSRPRRGPTALAVLLLALGMGQPVWAQDAEDSASGGTLPNLPAINRPPLDGPPPLNLGGPDNQTKPDASELKGKSSGGRWSAYAHAVQSAVEAALKANSKIRDKAFDVQYEMWIDPKGHVTRVQLVKPSGNTDLDAALRNEVLPRLALPEPVSDMPMPVKGHIAARVQQ